MKAPKAASLSLSEEARDALEKLVRRQSTAHQVLLRERIVLAADEKGKSEIVREMGLGVDRVRA